MTKFLGAPRFLGVPRRGAAGAPSSVASAASSGVSLLARFGVSPSSSSSEEPRGTEEFRGTRWAVAVDTRRCVGCNACVLACKAENGVALGDFRCWIATETTGTYPDLAMQIRSERCNQCSNSPCVTNCPTGASYVGRGGIVLVDRDLCTGCKACMAACPYDARFIHADGYADKCTFCAHRVARGELPACVANCPTKALTFGDLHDPSSEIATLLRERQHYVLKPEMGTEPNVFYLV